MTPFNLFTWSFLLTKNLHTRTATGERNGASTAKELKSSFCRTIHSPPKAFARPGYGCEGWDGMGGRRCGCGKKDGRSEKNAWNKTFLEGTLWKKKTKLSQEHVAKAKSASLKTSPSYCCFTIYMCLVCVATPHTHFLLTSYNYPTSIQLVFFISIITSRVRWSSKHFGF